ncbi:MAG: hypothetical protein IT368_16760, partial [Candidatus Hydrogenedentes bacterium]|nr:hypothetical protein [Candidatus Hydrogenedentota bacterium]
MFRYVAVFVVVALGSLQASPQVMPPALDRPVDFAKDVHPILAEHCGSCHMGGARKGGLSIDSREALLEGSEYGPSVKEGASAESRLIEVVAGLDPDTLMPPKGPRLNESQIGILRAWIDQGLPWDLEVSGNEVYIAPLK